jgi:cell wall-associated NlpC family hydrolase
MKSMLKKLPILTVVLFFVSCSSLKQIAFTNSNKQTSQPVASEQKEVKFLDNISSTTTNNNTEVAIANPPKNEPHTGIQSVKTKPEIITKQEVINYKETTTPGVEKTSPVQLKYALLMNTDVEEVQNLPLYESIDDWYGTPYRYGGTTKRGIDCSAFVQSVYISAFGVTLPRTAKEQYQYVKLISTTQLKEGDLLFFNTLGYVSHVGIYLRNNKFVQASVSGGVVITDMFDPYYAKHLVGVGRIENGAAVFHPENVYKSPYHKKKKHSKKKRSKTSSKKK